MPNGIFSLLKIFLSHKSLRVGVPPKLKYKKTHAVLIIVRAVRAIQRQRLHERYDICICFLHLRLYCPVGISLMGNWGCFPGESQLRQSRATQPTVHAGCFSVSIIHRTLTWTTGSLTCAQMLMHAIAHRDVQSFPVKERISACSHYKGKEGVPM